MPWYMGVGRYSYDRSTGHEARAEGVAEHGTGVVYRLLSQPTLLPPSVKTAEISGYYYGNKL